MYVISVCVVLGLRVLCGIRLQADKLLSPEFQPVLEQLVNHCARKRQICLFSATFPVTVKDFKDRHISNPYEINLMDELTLKVRLRWIVRRCLALCCRPLPL